MIERADNVLTGEKDPEPATADDALAAGVTEADDAADTDDTDDTDDGIEAGGVVGAGGVVKGGDAFTAEADEADGADGAEADDAAAAGPTAKERAPVAGARDVTGEFDEFDEDPWHPAGAPVLAALAVAWLAVALWAAYKNIIGDPTISLLAATQAGLALPGVVAASLVAGGALGVLGVGALANRFGGVERPLARLAAGAVGGLAAGLLGAGAVVVAYSHGSFLAAVAITVAVAAIAGGALAAVRPTAAVAAGLAGALAAALLGLVKGYFESDLLGLFGAGGDVVSNASAVLLLQRTTSVLSGLTAGLVAFWYLRRSGLTLPWPAYLLGGAIPGLLLFAGDGAAWLGGGPLLQAVGAASGFDGQVLASLLDAGFEHAMIVFFAGAIVATIAVGRTMRAR